MDPKIRARAQELRELNPGMKLHESHDIAARDVIEREGTADGSREPGCDDRRGCEPEPIGKTVSEVFHKQKGADEFPFDGGPRDKGEERPKHGPVRRGEAKRERRSLPTGIVRLDRALVELSHPAFKVYILLWRWRGAPAKGNLPFFTIHSLARFCGMTRHVVKRAIAELVSKGWIEPGQYDCHKKNSLYKLVPIGKVGKPSQ